MHLKLLPAPADDTAVVANRVFVKVVASVSDVVRHGREQIRAAPNPGAAIDGKFLTGIGTLDERMPILLDIERSMGSAEMGLVAAQAADRGHARTHRLLPW